MTNNKRTSNNQRLKSILFRKLMAAERKFQDAMDNLCDIDAQTVTALETRYDTLKECVTEAGLYDEYIKTKEKFDKMREHIGMKN